MRVLVQPQCRLRDAHLSEQIDRPLAQGVARQAQVQAHGLHNLKANGQHWIQRGQRILEDDADALATHFLHFIVRQLH